MFSPKDLAWRLLAHLLLKHFGGLGIHDWPFLVDLKTLRFHNVPPFYRGVVKMLVKDRMAENDSLYWLLQEPVVNGGRLDTLQSRDLNLWNCSLPKLDNWKGCLNGHE